MELLQTELRPFLAQLKLNGFEITFVDLPDVSFDYKTISSADIRSDMRSSYNDLAQTMNPDLSKNSLKDTVKGRMRIYMAWSVWKTLWLCLKFKNQI